VFSRRKRFVRRNDYIYGGVNTSMKNIILVSLVLLILITPAFAAGQQGGVHEPGTGLENVDSNGSDSENTDEAATQVQNQQGSRNVVQAQNVQQVRAMIQEHKEEMLGLQQQMRTATKTANQNQNEVQSAVHALLAMEDITGGIGPQVSAVAKEYDSSFQATLAAEEKIQSKGGFSRLLFGGDTESAEELEAEVTQNQNRIERLQQLFEQCDCDAETKQLLQEQMQTMEQEQTRLRTLAQEEKSHKGWFGWLKR
jgi:hypothetical protein